MITVTGTQILMHLIGDYIFQFDYQALGKKKPGSKHAIQCLTHCLTYTIPFLFLTRDIWALILIMTTHYLIDRTHIVSRFICWKNNLILDGMTPYSFEGSKSNMGHHPSRPPFISVWLGIITDNILHITINAIILSFA